MSGIVTARQLLDYYEELDEKEKLGFFRTWSRAESHDVKGLYKKARSGQLKNFTGIDSPYEVPAAPSLTLHTENETAEQSATRVVRFLQEKGIV